MDSTKPERDDLLMLLHQVTHALETELAAKLAEVGSTPRFQCVLHQAASGQRTQTEIAELSQLDKTTMVVTMDALERAGLARRVPSPSDRRARIIEVTDAGRAKIAEGQALTEQVYDDVLATLPADELMGLVAGLHRLAHGRLAEPVPCANPPRQRAVRVRSTVPK